MNWAQLQAAQMPAGNDPFFASMGVTPMFGQGQGPLVTGPLNIPMGGMTGMAAQLAGNAILPGLMASQGMQVGQFMPMQNAFDFQMAQQYQQAQQRAISMGAKADTASMHQLLMGTMRSMNITPTPHQRQEAFRFAEFAAQAPQYAAMAFGEEAVDQFHGARGSQSLLAGNLARTGYTMIDPVTGRHQWTGETAGEMAGEIYGRLYGPGKNIGEMKGIGAGEAGAMLRAMRNRGIGPSSVGSLSPQERYSMVADQSFSAADYERMSQRIGISSDELRKTHEKIRTNVASGAVDPVELGSQPGAESLIRSTDAEKISGKLKGMAGAVTAMKDILGSMGKKGTIEEIFNGLEAMTQGGFANMAPQRMEQVVRMTHALSQQTGLGMQAMMGLTAQGAQMADQLGLDRSFAVFGAQSTAAFGQAFGEVMGDRKPAWGSLSQEKATLLDQQLRLNAAASESANQLGATMRLRDMGFLSGDNDATKRLRAFAQAVEDHQTQWVDPATGKSRSLSMGRGEWTELMQQAGIGASTVRSFLSNEFGNQESIQQYGIQDTVREGGQRESMRQQVAATLQSTTFAAMQNSGLGKLLMRRGVAKDQRQVSRLSRDWARGAAEDYTGMDSDTYHDKDKRLAYLAKRAEERLATGIRNMGKEAGRSDAQIEADVTAAINSLGAPGPDGIRPGTRELAASIGEDVDTYVRNAPGLAGIDNGVAWLEINDPSVMATRRADSREAASRSAMQAAMGGLGRVGPLARITDALRGARSSDDWGKIGAAAIGGISDEVYATTSGKALKAGLTAQLDAEIYKGEDPDIAKQLATEAGQDWSKLSAADKEKYLKQVKGVRGKLTARGMQQTDEASLLIAAVTHGGDAAKLWREQTAAGEVNGKKLTEDQMAWRRQHEMAVDNVALWGGKTVADEMDASGEYVKVSDEVRIGTESSRIAAVQKLFGTEEKQAKALAALDAHGKLVQMATDEEGMIDVGGGEKMKVGDANTAQRLKAIEEFGRRRLDAKQRKLYKEYTADQSEIGGSADDDAKLLTQAHLQIQSLEASGGAGGGKGGDSEPVTMRVEPGACFTLLGLTEAVVDFFEISSSDGAALPSPAKTA